MLRITLRTHEQQKANPTMTKIVTVAQMRALEAAADAAGTSYDTMMDTAGRAVAIFTRNLMEMKNVESPRIAVLCGKGNNGGDGLVAARYLKEKTAAQVTIFLTEPREDDPKVAAMREMGVLIADGPTDAEQGYRVLKTMVANADIIIDAILGTGAQLPIRDELEKIMRYVHKALHDRADDQPPLVYVSPRHWARAGGRAAGLIRAPIIIAVDVPTGVDADTGAVDPNALHADHTITFEAAKPGLLMFPAAEAVGELHIAPLGLPSKLDTLKDVHLTLVDAQTVAGLIPERSNDSSKGTFGKVMIAAGSVNYSGAPALAALGAYRVGAGLVTVAAPQPIIGMISTHVMEATWLIMPHDMGVIAKNAARVLRDGLDGYAVLLIGPGLGQEPPTADFIDALFSAEPGKTAKARGFGFAPAPEVAKKDTDAEIKPLPPLVIDADALNLLAKIENWAARLPARSVLTPHPGEMARLCGFVDDESGKATDKVQADRWNLARTKAAEWKQIVLLKGAFTVVADPDGRAAVLPFATSALAKAGTGDVLAGLIAGLIAQGADPFDAAVAGAYVHGLAADHAIYSSQDNAAVLARDVLDNVGLAVDDISNAAE